MQSRSALLHTWLWLQGCTVLSWPLIGCLVDHWHSWRQAVASQNQHFHGAFLSEQVRLDTSWTSFRDAILMLFADNDFVYSLWETNFSPFPSGFIVSATVLKATGSFLFFFFLRAADNNNTGRNEYIQSFSHSQVTTCPMADYYYTDCEVDTF